MDFEFTEEQGALREAVRGLLEKHATTSVVRDLVERDVAPDALWSRLIGMDLAGIAVPEAAGGAGQGFIELAVVLEELGRVIAPGPFLATVTQYAPLIRECGTAEQWQRLLRPVAESGRTGTLAISGQAGCWDVGGTQVIARPGQGAAWQLEGVAHWVVDGATAAEVGVVARLEGSTGEDGIAVFSVPHDQVHAVPVHTFDPGRPVAMVTLDGAQVAAAGVVGEPGGCGRGVRRAIEEATVALALEMVGTCQGILDIALDHAKTREQFGVAIGSFQAMKHKFADMLVALERARATAYFAALTLAEDDERRTLAASMAKASAGDCQRLLAQEGIQSMGGMGFTWAHDMHLYAKRAKMGELLLGTSAYHRGRVAELIGLTPCDQAGARALKSS